MNRPLSVKRAADRGKMADRVIAIAQKCGASFECREGGEYPGPRCIRVEIKAPGGLQVGISFDGDSCQPGVFILHWVVRTDSPNKLKPSFGGVNPYHFCKATHVAYNFDSFCEKLQLGLEMAASGEVYQPLEAAVAE